MKKHQVPTSKHSIVILSEAKDLWNSSDATIQRCFASLSMTGWELAAADLEILWMLEFGTW
jgi:hypothetical protein